MNYLKHIDMYNSQATSNSAQGISYGYIQNSYIISLIKINNTDLNLL